MGNAQMPPDPLPPRATNPRRVVILASSLDCGGTERVAVNLARWLQESGHAVCLLTLAQPAADFYPCPPGIERRGLGLLGPSEHPLAAILANLRRVRAIRRSVVDFRTEILISLGDCMNVLALLASKGLECRKIISEQCDPVRQPIGRAWHALRALAYRWADLHVALSNYAADWFAKHFPRVRSVVIGNASAIPIDQCAGPLEMESGDIPAVRLLAVGRLSHQKGFDLLLESLALARPTFAVPVTLSILGAGPDRLALEALRVRLGLSDIVSFHGVVHDVHSHYRAADIYVMPSRWEGFPLTLMEAMSHGLPVVAANCPGGTADVLARGEYGLCVPVEDVPALAKALHQIVIDPALRTRLAQASRRRALDYSEAAICAAWRRVLEKEPPL